MALTIDIKKQPDIHIRLFFMPVFCMGRCNATLAKRKSHSRLKMAFTFIRILVHLRQMPRQQL